MHVSEWVWLNFSLFVIWTFDTLPMSQSRNILSIFFTPRHISQWLLRPWGFRVDISEQWNDLLNLLSIFFFRHLFVVTILHQFDKWNLKIATVCLIPFAKVFPFLLTQFRLLKWHIWATNLQLTKHFSCFWFVLHSWKYEACRS